ncbi:unnamed protein product [Rodentolepis nana]|uniref:Reverse transcriptase n=1 Tax=Rodentolepis nana TaxID=102285 RepID=A0A0R3TDT1_RODNA|nr:unnamed protein product [Rodentolepis nana]
MQRTQSSNKGEIVDRPQGRGEIVDSGTLRHTRLGQESETWTVALSDIPGFPDLKVQRTQSSNNRETVDSGTLRHSRLAKNRNSGQWHSPDIQEKYPHNEGLNQERIHVKDNNEGSRTTMERIQRIQDLKTTYRTVHTMKALIRREFMSRTTMKALIRKEFPTSMCNEIKARIPDLKVQRTQSSNNRETVDSGTLRHSRLAKNQKQWTVALSDIADWPKIEAFAEFRLQTRPDCLAKHLHRLGVYTQPTCPLCNLHEEMEKTHLIRCPALKTRTESQRYWETSRRLMNCY